MINGQSTPDLPDLLVRLFSMEQVVYREDHRTQISQPLAPDLHG